MPTPRRHDIDSLRVIALLLLIPYHVGMAYVADWDFHLKSAWTFEWLQWPMIALNRWRMPLLFALSGVALGLALPARGLPRFAVRRTLRLLVPLLAGIVLVVSLQAYVEARDHGDVGAGLLPFLYRYWQFRPWPGATFTGAAFGFTWNHLWYLAYLLPYSLLLITVVAALRLLRLPRWAPPQGLCTDRMIGIVGLLLPVAWLAWAILYVLPDHPPTHALLDDPFVHAESLPLFALGVAAARWERGWNLLQRWRWRTLALALLALTVELGIRALGRLPQLDTLDAWVLALPWAQTERIARAAYTWTAVLAAFGWARAHLQQPWRGLPYARDAVFSVYILHQTVLLLLLFWLRPLQLGPWLEAGSVLAGTLLGSLLIHELLIRRVRWLRPLFGLPVHAAGGSRAGPATAHQGA